MRKGHTLLVAIIHIQQRQVVAVWNGEQGFGSIGLLPLVVWADEDVRHGKHRNNGEDLIATSELGTADEHLRHLEHSINKPVYEIYESEPYLGV